MSDLSFLIQNQKQVIVDKSYLEKCQMEESQKEKAPILNSGSNRALSSRDVKINANFMPNKRKPNSPRSYNINNISSVKSETLDTNEQIYKMGMRVDALDENQKRLEQRFTKQLAALHEVIYKKKGEYSSLMAELNTIKSQINQSKKVIGHVLNDITTKK